MVNVISPVHPSNRVGGNQRPPPGSPRGRPQVRPAGLHRGPQGVRSQGGWRIRPHPVGRVRQGCRGRPVVQGPQQPSQRRYPRFVSVPPQSTRHVHRFIVNNAGYVVGRDHVGDIDESVVDGMFATNVLGLIAMTQLLVKGRLPPLLRPPSNVADLLRQTSRPEEKDMS